MELKQIREMTGMNQSQFAREFKIPLRTYQSWENGERKPAEYIVMLLEEVVKIRKRVEK